MKEITIYTDGACSGNPGPGGWGAVLIFQGNQKEISGGAKDTTNNIMEMRLNILKGCIPVQMIYTVIILLLQFL